MSLDEASVIPWNFQESPLSKSWMWSTKHFDAKIMGDGTRFIWTVTDKTRNRPIPLGSGPEIDFRTAEDSVRELIGKSYPTKYGYRAYAGSLATTFRIYTGERFDFGPMESSKVILVVRTRDNKKKIMTGSLRVVHHDITLVAEGGQAFKVPPSFIEEVRREVGSSAARTTKSERIGALGRTYKGEVRPGCTGIPGFDHGTVTHGPKAARCPVHE